MASKMNGFTLYKYRAVWVYFDLLPTTLNNSSPIAPALTLLLEQSEVYSFESKLEYFVFRLYLNLFVSS
jgi:hypothetical protein